MKETKLAQSLKAFAQQHKEQSTRGDGFKLDPRIIHVRPDFNVRNLSEMSEKEREEYDVYVDELAKAYAAGRHVPPITVKVVDGVPCLSDGHTRHTGMIRAIEVYGADLSRTPVDEFKGDDADEIAFIATSNNNRKLRPLELAKVYHRLEKLGKSNQEIATIMGKTVPHVIQTKSYYIMPTELKTMVFLDQIPVVEAAKLFGKYGTKAVDVAKELLAKAEQKGKGKVTSKVAFPRMSKKETRTLNTVTSNLYSSIKDVDLPENGGQVTVTLDAALIAQLKEIGEKAHQIENFEPEAAKSVLDKQRNLDTKSTSAASANDSEESEAV